MSHISPSGSLRDIGTPTRIRVQAKIMPSSSTDRMIQKSNSSIFSRSQSTELAININENDVMGMIAVNLPDKTRLKFNFSSKTTAKDLARHVCDKIGIRQGYIFGLKRFKNQNLTSNIDPSSLKIPWVWLTDGLEIFNQNCDSSTILTLSVKYWFNDWKEIEDLKTAEMMVAEMSNLLLEGVHQASLDTLSNLLAIQLQIQGQQSSTILSKKNLNQYLPSYILSKNSSNDIIKLVNLNQQGLQNVNRLDLNRRYLDTVRTNIKNLTISFFPALYVNKDMIRKLDLAIGISPDGVNIYENAVSNQLTLVSCIRYFEIEKVESKRTSPGTGTEERLGAPSPSIADIANMELNEAAASKKNRKPIDESELSSIEQQLTPGPYQHTLKIFNKNSALREWKFEVFSTYSEDSGVAAMIDNYRTRLDVYDQLLQTNFNTDYFINISLADGSFCKKLQINSLDSGEQVLMKFAEKIDLKDRSFFQLAAKEGDVYKWISLRQPVLIQVRPDSDLFLRLRFFFTHPTEIKDPVARHLYFLQAREQVQSGNLLATDSNIVELAALALEATIGNADEKKELGSCVKDVKNLVPARLFSLNTESNWKKKILKAYETLLERSVDSAEYKYLKIASDLPNYGITFFKAIIPKTGETCFLGAGILGACVYREQQMELLGFYRFGYELRSWKNISETVKFTVKASRNADEKIVSVVCCQFNEFLTLMSYYDQIRKTVKQTADIRNFN